MIDVINHPVIDTCGGIYKEEKAVCLTITDSDTNKTFALPIPIDVAIDLGNELIRLAYATKYKEGNDERD